MSLIELAHKAVAEHGAVQEPYELAALAGCLPRLKRVLEIGCRFGATLWLWDQLAEPGALLIGVDVDVKQVRAPLSTSVELVEMDSNLQSTADFVSLKCHEFDFVFVDGDHATSSVRRDHELYWPKLRSGGVMAFHDITESVYPFWREVHESCPTDKVSIVLDRPGWGLPDAQGYPGYGGRLGIGVAIKP